MKFGNYTMLVKLPTIQRTIPKHNIQALGKPESHTGIKLNKFIKARNIVLKTYRASGRNLAPQLL